MADQKTLSIENLQTAMLENNTKLKNWVTEQLNTMSIFKIEWVNELPTENISGNTLYMVKSPSSTKENNIYVEYVYNEETSWEILGQIDVGSIDLTNYYNKQEIDDLLANIKVSLNSYTEDEIKAMVAGIWGE